MSDQCTSRDPLPRLDSITGVRREPDRRAAMRLLAIANALEGLSRAEAALATGFSDQAHLTNAMRRQLGMTPGTLVRAGAGRAELSRQKWQDAAASDRDRARRGYLFPGNRCDLGTLRARRRQAGSRA